MSPPIQPYCWPLPPNTAADFQVPITAADFQVPISFSWLCMTPFTAAFQSRCFFVSPEIGGIAVLGGRLYKYYQYLLLNLIEHWLCTL